MPLYIDGQQKHNSPNVAQTSSWVLRILFWWLTGACRFFYWEAIFVPNRKPGYVRDKSSFKKVGRYLNISALCYQLYIANTSSAFSILKWVEMEWVDNTERVSFLTSENCTEESGSEHASHHEKWKGRACVAQQWFFCILAKQCPNKNLLCYSFTFFGKESWKI